MIARRSCSTGLDVVWFVVVVGMHVAWLCNASPRFESNIPNARALYPVVLGHSGTTTSSARGGNVDKFGAALKSAGYNWKSICSKDSDADGKTNGEELGDPKCEWSGGPSPQATGITDPGKFDTLPKAVVVPVAPTPKPSSARPTTRRPTAAGETLRPTTPTSVGGQAGKDGTSLQSDESAKTSSVGTLPGVALLCAILFGVVVVVKGAVTLSSHRN